MNDYIQIEYKNSVDFGNETPNGNAPIVYHNGFMNRIYLDADVSKPEYELVEEGVEDSDGEFTPTFQRWAKKYSIEVYAQEFLVDALTLMAAHDSITITLKNGESSNVTDISVDPKWDSTIECWALVTINFATSYIVRTSCNENLEYGCKTPIITVESAYDADGAGQSYWEGTGAVNGATAFFYKGLEGGDSVYTGDPLGFYMFTDGEWVIIDMENGDFGEVTDLSGTCIYLVKSSPNYYRVPFIRSITDDGGGDCTISAYGVGVESTFYQVQYDNGGWTDLGDPQFASVFDNGFQVSPGAGTWDFRIKWYTHSCDYGYSNEVTQTVT